MGSVGEWGVRIRSEGSDQREKKAEESHVHTITCRTASRVNGESFLQLLLHNPENTRKPFNNTNTGLDPDPGLEFTVQTTSSTSFPS